MNPDRYSLAAADRNEISGHPAAIGDPAVFLPKLEPGRFGAWLARRAWLVLLPMAVLAALGWMYAGRMPQIYRSGGSVYVKSEAPVILDIQAVSKEETQDLEQMRSVEQGLAANTLLKRVIDAHGLAADPDFAPRGASEETLVRTLQERVKAELRRGSRLIDLSVDDTDPQRAKQLVLALVSEYEKWSSERQKSITLQAGEGLALEEISLRAKLDVAAKEVQDFREKHPVPGLSDAETRPGGGRLGALDQELSQATAERLRLESELEAHLKFNASDPDSVAGISKTRQGEEVLALVRNLQAREADFSRVKERYLHKHPVFREAENEVDVARKQLVERVKSAGEELRRNYAVAAGNEEKLAAAVAKARAEAVDADGVRDRFRDLTRKVDAQQALYDSVVRRLRETQMAAAVSSSFLRWNDTPMVPENPVSPRKMIYAAGGGFVGTLLGCLLLAGVEIGDRKIRSAAAASKVLGSPLLVTVPPVNHPGESMILLGDPASEGAEAFRRLRVLLSSSVAESGGRSVAFASAKPGEGKSFCALNYATSLAMQGRRTLLIDADLRSPGISRDYFQGGVESGLGAYLKGAMDPASACFATALPNLYLLSSGPMRPDAAELLGGTRFPALLEDAFRWFDRVVIDTPDVLAASDGLSVARCADRVCVVVREGAADRRDLKKTADLLRSSGANLTGFIWNEAPRKNHAPHPGGPLVPASRLGTGGPEPVAVTALHQPLANIAKNPRQKVKFA